MRGAFLWAAGWFLIFGHPRLAGLFLVFAGLSS